MKTTKTRATTFSGERAKLRQVLDCGDRACGVTAFAGAALLLQRLADDRAMPIQSGDSADSVAAVQDALAPNAAWVIRQLSKLSALLFLMAITASLLLLYPPSAHAQGGVPLWTNHYHGPALGNSMASAIAVDSSGSVFVTGHSFSGPGADFTTVKYSNAGMPLWTNIYDFVTGGSDVANAIAVDNTDNVVVTGVSSGDDYATVAYSNAGVPLWTNRYDRGNLNGSSPTAIAVDASGNVFVTGSSSNGTTSDFATVAYSSAGVPLWTNVYDGAAKASDIAKGIAVDNSGNVFVTGSSWNGRYYDFVTIKYSSSVPPPRLDFRLLKDQLVLSWTDAGSNLQSAPAVTGSFTNLPAATSPYTNVTTSAQQFFRLNAD